MKRKLAVEEWTDTDFVTVFANGSIGSPDAVPRAFDRALTQINPSSDMRIHNFQHSHAGTRGFG